MNKILSIAVTIAMGMAASGASAASFFAGHGFNVDDFCNTSTSSGAFASGTVIGYTAQACSGGYTVDLDTAAQTITMTNIVGSHHGNYVYSKFLITGIAGLTITGLTTIQSDPLFRPASYAPVVPSPELSFTGSSVTIVFNTVGVPNGQFNFGGDGGQAIFSYTAVFGPVPEAATWAMMIAGFGLVGASMRRMALATA